MGVVQRQVTGAPKVSVCVPAYNRPDTIDRLIRSFLRQRAFSAELVISDDSPTYCVRQVVDRYKTSHIRYVHNTAAKGYCENLKAALLLAHGEVSIILGDDDFFVSDSAITRYWDLFSTHPSLTFAYTNRYQVDRHGNPDVAHRFFSYDELFHPGEDAWSNIWHHADCIAGIAVRVQRNMIEEVIPRRSILYPQSLLVGMLMRDGMAAGIADFLVAVSADETLLGYQVNRGNHVYGDERHGSIEYLDMVPKVVTDPVVANRVADKVGRQLALSLAVTLPDEKTYCGWRIAARNGVSLLRRSRSARRSLPLLVSVCAVIVVPASLLQRAKRMVKRYRRQRQAALWTVYERARTELDSMARDAGVDGGTVAIGFQRLDG